MRNSNRNLAPFRSVQNLLDEACGIGLWEAVLHNGDALHAQSHWTWSADFRRLVGYTDVQSFPNVVQSWSDKLHPDDVAPTFAAFAEHLEDKTGKSRYSVNYENARWLVSVVQSDWRCAHQADGKTIRACGSLTNVNDGMLLKERMEREAASDQVTVSALAEALAELAQGNLTHRITAEFSAKTAGLRSDFNETANKLQETLKAVSVAASGILSGSSEISTSSDDLSRRTEQQAASLEETAAALDQITVNVALSKVLITVR